MDRGKKKAGMAHGIGEDLRLNPQLRLCSKFDPDSIARFPVAKPGEMGMRVLDNCAEEHIM